MAKLSSDGKYVTVEKGDTLGQIAIDFAGGYSKYKQLASINNISNPDFIAIGQKIYLTSEGASSGTSSTGRPAPTITQFGLLSTSDNTLFATWTWDKDKQTKSYKVLWRYTTMDGVELVGESNEITVDEHYYAAAKQDTYNIPSGAVKVTFRVKPISKTKNNNNTESTYFDADWSEIKTHTVSSPLDPPQQPSLKVEELKLTAEVTGLDDDATGVKFRLIKNNTTIVNTTKEISYNQVTKYASYVWNSVDTGCEYKVCAQAIKGKLDSEWSAYSNIVKTIPAAPMSITSCKATDETTVYLSWTPSKAADSYEIEYTTKLEYFDASGDVTKVPVPEGTGYYITNMETGKEYFFRIRAVNDAGESEWTAVSSVVIGSEPAAPTTWSSTTVAVVGEVVNLYWVHNSEDGSSETFAELELYINDELASTEIIRNTAPEDEKDETKFYALDTAPYAEGVTLQWRVRTAGITNDLGDWSIQRTVDIYAQPTLKLDVAEAENVNGELVVGDNISEITKFPFFVSAVPGPKTQKPIGYHLSVTADEAYDSVDAIGNPIFIKEGQEVYSKYFDTNYELLVMISAGNIDLEKNISYTITVQVTMDSGLTAEASLSLPVTWSEIVYTPNASIGVDGDSYTAYIVPYCEERRVVYRKVDNLDGKYIVTDTEIGYTWGEIVVGAYTTSGEQVYSGTSSDGVDVYFCIFEETTMVDDVLLSVYRREFDGTFTLLAADVANGGDVTVTDPHPALDYARYRIVATSTETGAVSHYDLPGYPVGGKSVIIQWNEEWTQFEVTDDDELARPAWSGSLLKLPYNIDISDSHSADVSLVEYIGRTHPVSYYGTHRGETATWTVAIPKNDKETLYALRRLAIWMGDVYVREPSGSGYWAHISVGFSQKHLETTIPVTLTITRVEGGV